MNISLNDKIKEAYIDLEIINYYLVTLNNIHIKLETYDFKSLTKTLPSIDLIMKLINNLSIIRFKLLKEIINNTKINKMDKKIKFNMDNKCNIKKLFDMILKLINKYKLKQNNKQFLNFIISLNDSSIIEYTIEQIGAQFEKIINSVESNVKLCNQIKNEVDICVDVVYIVKYKFDDEFFKNKIK